MDTEFSEYDHGYRLGTFDKCNGRTAPRIEETGDIFSTGYYDAWDGNEAKINEPTEEELAEAANEAGRAMARKLSPGIREGSANHGDFSEEFWDGFYDEL